MTHNKTEVAQKCMEETGLDIKMPDLTKRKTSDKMAQMMKSYKDWRSKIVQTGWGLNVDTHDSVYTDDDEQTTVKALTLRKCFFYYEFEGLLGSNVAITPSYVMESGQPDRVNLEPLQEPETRMAIDPDLESTTSGQGEIGKETIEKADYIAWS